MHAPTAKPAATTKSPKCPPKPFPKSTSLPSRCPRGTGPGTSLSASCPYVPTATFLPQRCGVPSRTAVLRRAVPADRTDAVKHLFDPTLPPCPVRPEAALVARGPVGRQSGDTGSRRPRRPRRLRRPGDPVVPGDGGPAAQVLRSIQLSLIDPPADDHDQAGTARSSPHTHRMAAPICWSSEGRTVACRGSGHRPDTNWCGAAEDTEGHGQWDGIDPRR